MEIVFTGHASQKINLYQIIEEEIKQIVKTTTPSYFDIQKDTLIILGSITLPVGPRKAVIVVMDDMSQRKIVTVYPCSDLDKEISKKIATKRWITIESNQKELV